MEQLNIIQLHENAVKVYDLQMQQLKSVPIPSETNSFNIISSDYGKWIVVREFTKHWLFNYDTKQVIDIPIVDDNTRLEVSYRFTPNFLGVCILLNRGNRYGVNQHDNYAINLNSGECIHIDERIRNPRTPSYLDQTTLDTKFENEWNALFETNPILFTKYKQIHDIYGQYMICGESSIDYIKIRDEVEDIEFEFSQSVADARFLRNGEDLCIVGLPMQHCRSVLIFNIDGTLRNQIRVPKISWDIHYMNSFDNHKCVIVNSANYSYYCDGITLNRLSVQNRDPYHIVDAPNRTRFIKSARLKENVTSS